MSYAMKKMRHYMAKQGLIPVSRVLEADDDLHSDPHEVDPGEEMPSPVHGEEEDNGYYDSEEADQVHDKYFEGGEVGDSGIETAHSYFDGGEVSESGISAPENEEHEVDGHDGELHNENRGELQANQSDYEEAQFAHGGRMALGGGGRFEKLTHELSGKGAHDPKALAAWIGRKSLGKAKFQGLAAKGRARAAKMSHGGMAHLHKLAKALKG